MPYDPYAASQISAKIENRFWYPKPSFWAVDFVVVFDRPNTLRNWGDEKTHMSVITTLTAKGVGIISSRRCARNLNRAHAFENFCR